MSMWTKEQYLNWIKSRPKDPADWKHSDAVEADRHIKGVTIDNLMAHPTISELPEPLKNWVECYASFGYGSVETNDMLVALNAYPDYAVFWAEEKGE